MSVSLLPTETFLNGLTFRETIHDTPNFRANVRKFEEQLDHFEKWLDGISKALRLYIEESMSKLCQKKKKKKAIPLFSLPLKIEVLNTFAI